MRILWLSHLVPYPPKGGVLQRSYHLLHELTRYHEVDLLAFNQPNLLKPMFASLDEGLLIAKRELGSFCNTIEVFDIESTSNELDKIRLALKSLFTKDPYNINWLKSQIFADKIRQYVDSNNYDLVHFDTISLVPYLNQIGDLPCVLDHHNIESHMLLHRASKENNWLKKLYYWQEGRRLNKYEKKYCPHFSLNITCSELDAVRLKSISEQSLVATIPNGVDTDYFIPLSDADVESKSENVKRITFIGRLNWYPNREAVKFIAKEIWPKLKTVFPDLVCDIIGANPPQEIIDLAAKDPRFHVHGFVDDIFPFMSGTSIYVCPITDGGGTKLKILDSLAMGMPVVANPFSCEGILVENGKNVMFSTTTDEYVDCITILLNDSDKRKQLGINARRLIVENYSYLNIGKLYSEHCIAIVNKD